jgi:hypothetical protein
MPKLCRGYLVSSANGVDLRRRLRCALRTNQPRIRRSQVVNVFCVSNAASCENCRMKSSDGGSLRIDGLDQRRGTIALGKARSNTKDHARPRDAGSLRGTEPPP